MFPPCIEQLTARRRPWAEPLSVFEPYSEQKGAVLLTGQGCRENASFSLMATRPAWGLSYDLARLSFESFASEKICVLEGMSLDQAVRTVQENLAFSRAGYPFAFCGGIGLCAYSLVEEYEPVGLSSVVSYPALPFQWSFFHRYQVFDHRRRLRWEIEVDWAGLDSPGGAEGLSEPESGYLVGSLEQDDSEEEYGAKVERIREYIREGEVYEVNLSQQFTADFSGNPYTLFQQLYATNPASYAAFWNLGETVFLSGSPELFLRCRGPLVETRPIKGTRPRGRTTEEDERLQRELNESSKDQAELHMIVDLMRNDLSRCCLPGSVVVREPHRLESHANVHHLIGIVDGRLSPDAGYAELLRAVFPGGSITGCPKRRCMRIIDALENRGRGYYTGSLFLMNDGRLDANIIIRSAIVHGGKIYLDSGGAVTIDSDPQEEYKEMQVKLSSWKKVLNFASKEPCG